MIITLSGVDGSGKDFLGKKLANVLDYNIWSDDPSPHIIHYEKNEWQHFVSGLNISFMQVFKTFDNFIKPRYALDEYVYQKVYKRSGIDQNLMEKYGLEKHLCVLIDISYETYLRNVSSRNEEIFSIESFDYQRNLFIEAFDNSIVSSKIIIENNSTPKEFITKFLEFFKEKS